MRTLDEKEKEIVDMLLLERSDCLPNMIDDLLRDTILRVDVDKKTCDLYYYIPKNETGTILKRIWEHETLFHRVVTVLSLLEKEALIFFVAKAENTQAGSFDYGPGCADCGLTEVHYKIPDPQIAEKIVLYCTKHFIKAEALKDFQRDGYVLRDEVRFRKQIRTALTALCVAAAGVIVNAGFNIYKMIDTDDDYKIKIYDNRSFDDLNKSKSYSIVKAC
jgi:hypothetical protein